MPRLADFGAKHSSIEINLVVSDRYLDLTAEDIDIAIRYAPTKPSDGTWKEMFKEAIFPVFSPRYPARTRLKEARDLLNEKLLYLSGRYRLETLWTHWFQQQGLAPPDERVGMRVNTYINMLQAAIEGQGIALAGPPLVDRYLEDGSLLFISSIAPLERDRYYLCCRSETESAKLFCDWLNTGFAESGNATTRARPSV